MFEEQDCPVPLGVAMLAAFAKLPLMLVIFLVAGVTVDRCCIFVEMSLMAGYALGSDMLPPQRIRRV